MKNIKEMFVAGCFILFILFGSTSFGQDSSNYVLSFIPRELVPTTVQMDNELEPSNEGTYENIHTNPLLLNGRELNYDEFGLQSEGILTVIAGDPGSQESMQIPFTINLRRYGKVLNDPAMPFLNHELNEVEVSSVMRFAKPGDQLIITPTQKKYWKAKRILRVVSRTGC